MREAINFHAQLVAQYLAHRKKDKTKNFLDGKAIFLKDFERFFLHAIYLIIFYKSLSVFTAVLKLVFSRQN